MYGDPEGAGGDADDDASLNEQESWLAAPGVPYAEAFGGRTAEDPLLYTGGVKVTGANDPRWAVPPHLRPGGTAADTHGVLGMEIADAGEPGAGPHGPSGPFGTPEGWRAQAAPTGLGGGTPAPPWLGAYGRLPEREGCRG